MNKIAIITRGIPGVGKSTVIEEIVKVIQTYGFSYEICSTDDFFIDKEEYKFDVNKLQENHLKNQDKFFNALKNGIDLVVCDNTNLSSWEAKPYYNMAKQFDYKVVILDFALREIDDILNFQTHNVPIEIIKEMIKKYNDEKLENFSFDEVIQILPEEFEKIKEIIGDLIVKKLKTYNKNEIEIIPREYRIIIEEFHKKEDKVLTAYDIKHLIDKSTKQIERYFDNLAIEFKNIIQIKKGKRKAYKLIDNFDVFVEIFKETDDIEELLYIATESNPELFKKLGYTLKGDDIYMFKGAIFEALQDKKIFNSLKNAIKYNEYRIIKFFNENKKEVKPIKLVFVDNNWYIAYVENEVLKLGRISFLEKVEYSTKNSYHKSSIQTHLKDLENNIQNSMTLFDKPKQIAKIKATPYVAKYFKKEMKKFFISQNFIKEQEDGSVIFSIEYTQPLEILPFIQKWLPDLIILSPKELQDEYLKKLELAIKSHN